MTQEEMVALLALDGWKLCFFLDIFPDHLPTRIIHERTRTCLAFEKNVMQRVSQWNVSNRATTPDLYVETSWDKMHSALIDADVLGLLEAMR